jgi:hypothetical protein
MAKNPDHAVAPRLAQELFAERIAAVPQAVAEVLSATATPPSDLAAVLAAPRFVITGGGFSEGPARVLAALLERAGRPARYLPLSSFAAPTLPRTDAALILFSQGLAPNARLPLAHVSSFAKTLVFTSVNRDAEAGPASMPALAEKLARGGVVLWRHPPAKEDQLLVRVVGPAAALACALRFVELCDPASSAPRAQLPLPAATEPPIDLFSDGRHPLAIVAGDELCELSFPLRWKLLEGLRACDPPVWDFLQVIHGPLQAFYDAPLTLLTIERAAHPHERELADRLATLLHPGRHRLIRFTIPKATAKAEPPARSLIADLLHIDAALNAALLHTVRTHDIDLGNWPLRNRDDALYAIDPATLNLPGWNF